MRSWGLRRQVVTLVVLPFMAVCAGTGLVVVNSYYQELRLLDARQGERMARMLGLLAAPGLTSALNSGTTEELQQLVDSAVEDRAILRAIIRSPGNRVLASAGEVVPGAVPATAVRLPIYPAATAAQVSDGLAAGDPRGWVELTIGQPSIAHTRYQTLAGSLLIILLSLLLIAFLGGRLMQFLYSRFQLLTSTLANLDADDWNTRLTPHETPEWRELAEAVDQLTTRTRRRMATLQSEATHNYEDLQATLEQLELSNIELDLARREAQSASRVKSDFLANTSHEIRTPLSGIIGFSNALLQMETEPRKREYLTSVTHAAEHLLAILNDILDLSKIEAGKFVLEQRPFSLLHVVEDSARLFAEQAAARGVELIVDCDPALPRRMLGDALRMKQIVTNLVSNAVKFTDRGQILIRLSHAGDRETLTVTDTGIGIADHQRAQLFEAFQQADLSDARRRGGTGLGLTIVRNLAQRMNAELDVDSTPGRGSRFTLSLTLPPCPEETPPQPDSIPGELIAGELFVYDPNPDTSAAVVNLLRRKHLAVTRLSNREQINQRVGADSTLILGLSSKEPVDRILTDPPQCHRLVLLLPSMAQTTPAVTCVTKPATEQSLLEALLPSSAPVLTPDHRMKVLVVDDNPGNRQLLGMLLNASGADPVLCDGGEQAIVHCRRENFPLILVDLQMPGLDGSDTVRQIRRTNLNGRSHIIALSAADTQDRREALLEAGFDDCLLKPMSVEQIQQALQRALPDQATPVDMDEALARSNHNADLARELLRRFLALLPDQARAFEGACRDNDSEALRSTTHQLLGAVGYVGTPALRQALNALWAELQTDRPEDQAVAPLAESVSREIQRLLAWESAQSSFVDDLQDSSIRTPG